MPYLWFIYHEPGICDKDLQDDLFQKANIVFMFPVEVDHTLMSQEKLHNEKSLLGKTIGAVFADSRTMGDKLQVLSDVSVSWKLCRYHWKRHASETRC